MNWAEVKKFLDENKESAEVKAYNSEIEKAFLAGKEVTDKIKAESEKAVNEFKSKGMSDIFKAKENELKETHLKEFKSTYKIEEPKDPEMARLLKDNEEIKKTLLEKDRFAKRLEIKNKVLPKLKGFEDLADVFISDDEAKTTEMIDKFSGTLEGYLKNGVEAALKLGQYVPPERGGAGVTPPNKEIDLTGMSDDQVRQMIKQI